MRIGYRERAVPPAGDPLSAAARFARRAAAPVTVYERGGEWCCGSGALAEVVLYWDRIEHRAGGDWRSEPVAGAPLRSLARVLADLPVADWRACGWAGFELGPRTLGLPGPIAPDPLVHLVVPVREARLRAAGALLRAVDEADLDALAEMLADPDTDVPGEPVPLADLEHDAAGFMQRVGHAIADIAAGRLRKVIVSRPVPVEGEIDLIAGWELGRRGNTPARSFLLDLGGLRAAGFSPETVIEVDAAGRVSTQPLAGTAALHGGPGDQRRREELLSDPKEIYEHAVAVQAAQDELRPLCAPGSLVVEEFMTVLERGSVQHLASRVSGRLAAGRDGWDALGAVFPSVTATGVPKAAACAAIRDYEPHPRGLYSGAVIAATADGAIDAALVLRTVFQRAGRTWLQAGAGVVGASRPERELEETHEKLRSVAAFLVPAARAAGSGPAGSAELEVLRRTVAELLEEDPAELGDDDNLFERGLESIALIRVLGQWRRAGIEVNFAELAETPTIDGWYKLLAARSPATAPPAGIGAGRPTPRDESAQPAAGDAEFPLALMQHAYWIGRGAGQPHGGVAAHIYTEFDGTGVDPARLSAALHRIVERHEALRTRITDHGSQVVQATSGWRGLTVHDLRELGHDTVAARLAGVRDRMSHQMLDIEAGEVFATALSLLPDGTTRFHLDVDMVAADAVSYRVLLADLARAYADPDRPVPPPTYSFRRYRADRAAALSGLTGGGRREAAERARRAWLDRLAGLPGAPQLPTAPTSGNGAAVPRVTRRHFHLPAAEREALTRAAHRHGITPAVAVATAFAEVLGGWSTQQRFLLNVPLFDREQLHPDVNRIVGDFTSSVLLDVDLTDEVPFVERARRIQTRLHADAAHADYSGVEVLRDLSRHRGEPVLAPVVFTSALGLGELFDAGVRQEFGRPVWIISQGPQVLLDAQVTELDGGLLVNWDLRQDALAAGVADAMFAAFERLVHDLAERDPDTGTDGAGWDRPVGDLLDPAARAVRVRANDVAGPASARLLHEGFFAAAARRPEAPALVWDAGRVTYGELAGRARAVAAGLIAHGVRPGDSVGISLPKGPDQVPAVLGVLAVGATYVPIAVDQPAARVARIVAAAGLRIAVTAPSLGRSPTCGPRWPADVALLRLDELPDAAADPGGLVPTAHDEPARLDEPAYVLFTSGSTGAPKGVEVGHRAAMNTIDDLIDRLGIGPGDRTLAFSALDFDLSVFDLFAPLSVGGAVVVVDEESRREAGRWAELIAGHGVTILNCVPAVLDLILQTGTPLGTSLRAVLLGGDRVGVDLPARLASAVPGCRFLALGGTTETAIHSTVCEITGGGSVPAEWTCVPYGTPLRNVALRVVDALGRDCPDHVAGELWIGGAGVAHGYRGDPERTADRFVLYAGRRWYRTGDLARYAPDGTVEFLGRADNQVKIRGFRVELGEIEAALAALPGVRAGVAAVTAAAGGRAGTLGALVVPAAGEAVDPGEVRAGLRAVLPPHMVPDQVVAVAELPLSANGKVDRKAVAALLSSGTPETRPEASPPTSDLERVIRSIWQEVLGQDDFGVTDEFFVLGGDSWSATVMVTLLRQELDTDAVTVRMLFAAPTIAALAEAMRAADTVPGRVDRVAAIAWEIATLPDEVVEQRLLDAAGSPDGAGPAGADATGADR